MGSGKSPRGLSAIVFELILVETTGALAMETLDTNIIAGYR